MTPAGSRTARVHRSLSGSIAVVAALLVAACSQGSTGGTASASGGTVLPSPEGSVAATSTAASETSRGGVSVADLVGTWTGEVTKVAESGDRAKDSTWSMRLTIDHCVAQQTCGEFSSSTRSVEGTGKAATCAGTLKYRGFYADRAAFAFEEKITSSEGATRCAPLIMALTPLASGATLGVEEKKMSWPTYGVLVRSAAP